MSPIRVTWGRTIGRLRNQFSSALTAAGFLAAVAAFFAFNLENAEGTRLSLVALWSLSVSPFLPALVALLAMDVWSEERQSGRVDLLLTVAVREREYVLGKFFGVWTYAMLAVLASLVVSLLGVSWFAPAAAHGVDGSDFVPALLFLACSCALWTSAAVLISAVFRHGAAAAVASVLLFIALPRGLWEGAKAWFAAGRTAFGEFPLDAQAVDFASGLVSNGTIAGYLIFSGVFLFVGTKLVAGFRLVGKGARVLRFSTATAIVMSLIFAVLATGLCLRYDFALDFTRTGATVGFSARTRNILMESSGTIDVTCFMARNDGQFRAVGHLLRALKRESERLGGGRFELHFVDPHWDLGAAERLVRRGVTDAGIVFERGHRLVVLPLKDGVGERLCASTIRRLTTSPLRRNVYWTTGHGESSFNDYKTFGMSDVARDLAHEGFLNSTLDLATAQPVPADCALIVVAGAKTDFSRAEIGRLETYLRDGGRLLALVNSSIVEGGLASLLSAWGIRLEQNKTPPTKTLSGTDLIVSDFSEHAIAAPLQGSRVVLEQPLAFTASVAAETGRGADRIAYTPLASAGARAYAVTVERGAGAGQDLALRPTRIVAIGDSGFAMNGALSARANANRDLFLNSVAFLSGTDVAGSGETDSGLLDSSMDRNTRFRHALVTIGVFPLLVFLILAGVAIRRSRRHE